MRQLRKILVVSIWLGVVLGVLFVGFFLQEFGGGDLPQRIATLGLHLPLEEPSLVVSTGKMTLSLMEGETLVKRYDAGFGRELPGRVIAGATPYGEFRIIKKLRRKHIFSRGSRFLQLDYPSAEFAELAYAADRIDSAEMERILAAHASGGRIPSDTSLGGPLGIQGNFFSIRGRRHTDGSVALSNGDINELFEVVPLGTPVIIQP